MKRLNIEIADTPAQLARGLMGREELPKNSGMLFKFPQVLEASFWGKDTYIPLDIAFINEEGMIDSIENIVPMSTRTIRSNGNCIMAIEANAGYFRKNGISPGHKIKVIKNEEGNEVGIEFDVTDNQ